MLNKLGEMGKYLLLMIEKMTISQT